MTTACDQIGGINLAQGVCDTPVPPVVQAAAIQAINDGHNIYTRLDGIARLRNAIAAKQKRDYALAYDPNLKSWSPPEPPVDFTRPAWPCSTPAMRSSSSSPSTATTPRRSNRCASIP